MDTSETLVMFGVVALCLLFVSGLMVNDARLATNTRCDSQLTRHPQIGTAWLLGAQFPNIFKEASILLQKLNDPAPAVTTAITTAREEL